MTWSLAEYLEPARAGDPALDYCLWPYARPAAPEADGLRSSALLFQSFAVAGVSGALPALAKTLRDGLGRFATVFGVKWAGGRLSWEFYFYDYARWERRLSMAKVADILRGALRWHAPVDDTKPFFMFSVEVDERHALGAAALDRVDVYVGVPDSGVSAGICYGLDSSGYELRNLYYFYDARTQRDAALAKAFASVRFDGRRLPPERLFWPEMEAVETLVVANKRQGDGIYFSRIGVDQLLHFLRRAGFPEGIADFVAARRGALKHHLYDVGYDYAIRPGGELRILKGSFYGLL